MTGGKGGLNIKDYPFAFSLAALIFPSLLTGMIIEPETALAPDEQTKQEFQNIGILFAVTIFGGMVGSFLTIVDPFGLFIRWIYRRRPKHWIIKNLRRNSFIENLIDKNYDAALKSPSITYETDKIVGIFYFFVILCLTSYRLKFDENFRMIFPLEDFQLEIAFYFTIVILIGISLIMLLNVKGIRKSVSHLQRIEIVTILFSANDLTNISIEGNRTLKNFPHSNYPNVIGNVQDQIIDLPVNSNHAYFKTKFNHTEVRNFIVGQLKVHNYDIEKMTERWWNYFLIVRDLAKRYEVSIKDALVWHKNKTFITAADLDSPLSNLQSSVDTRDWQNAVLKTTRITDYLEQFFLKKGF